MLEYALGDATEQQQDGPTVIAHIVNDIGKWGSGFVVAMSTKWPRAELKYRQWASGRLSVPLKLGHVQIVRVGPDTWVANMCAQHGVRRIGDTRRPAPIRYDSLRVTLDKVADFALAHQATVQMPRIGCGRAGGSWEAVEALVRSTMTDRGVSVRVCDMSEAEARLFAPASQTPGTPRR